MGKPLDQIINFEIGLKQGVDPTDYSNELAELLPIVEIYDFRQIETIDTAILKARTSIRAYQELFNAELREKESANLNKQIPSTILVETKKAVVPDYLSPKVDYIQLGRFHLTD